MHKKILVLGLLLVSLLTSVSFGLVFKYDRNDVSAFLHEDYRPRQVAYDSSNNLIFVLAENPATGRCMIRKYLSNGREDSTSPILSSHLTAKDMAIDSSGNIFNIGTNEINKLARDGKLLSQIGWSTEVGEARLIRPLAIAIHGANLFVFDQVEVANPKVKRYYTSSGRFIDEWQSPFIAGTTSFAVGNNFSYFAGGTYLAKYPRLGADRPTTTEAVGDAHALAIAVGYVESYGVFAPMSTVGESSYDLFRYSSGLTSRAALGIPPVVGIVGGPTRPDIAIKSDASTIALLLPSTCVLSIYTKQ